MFKDDIQALPDTIPDGYDSKLILAEQIRLVMRHLPLALLGTVFTALCFFATMFITYDLNTNQKILNIVWLIYQVIILGMLLFTIQLILKKTDSLSILFLKRVFRSFAILFSFAMAFGVFAFVSMLYRVPLMELNAAKAMILIWIVFHIVLSISRLD